jgi:acyl carrier protein
MERDEAVRMIGAALGEIAPEVRLEGVDPGAELAEELDLDSMDLLELHTRLEEASGVEFPESARSSLATLDQLVAHLTVR